MEGLAVSTMSTVGISSGSMTTLEGKQDYELTNIINKTIKHFNTNETNPKIPIYLCGDFNRHTSDKETWVRSIIKKLQQEQDEDEFEEL
jgi:S-ribosylhomocysteine lyase LuxS involved in autoinducer biosynthesis